MPSSCATRMYSVCIEGGELTDAIRSVNGAWEAAGVIRLTRRHSAAVTVAYFDISFRSPIPSIARSHPDETEHPFEILMIWRSVRPIYPCAIRQGAIQTSTR